MLKLHIALVTVCAVTVSAMTAAQATPEEDRVALQKFFTDKYKNIDINDYKNGAYIFSEDARSQWEAMEEFPPYEDQLAEGETLWSTPFANGKSFKDCFGEEVDKIQVKYPMYDEAKDTILTVESEINTCLEANGEDPLKYKKGDMASLSGYIASQARGQKIDVKIPNEKAQAWYDKGKAFFYAKRGQLNMSCADCHVSYAGSRIRAEILSPAIGQVTNFPTYRAKWGQLGTLHRRYSGCNEQVRAKPFAAQSDEYKALEYFHTYMSNGQEWNGPAFRK